MNEQEKKLLTELIWTDKKEWMKSKVNEWIYLKEVLKPTNMGKEQAEQGLALWQKHTKAMEQSIIIFEQYEREHTNGTNQ